MLSWWCEGHGNSSQQLLISSEEVPPSSPNEKALPNLHSNGLPKAAVSDTLFPLEWKDHILGTTI